MVRLEVCSASHHSRVDVDKIVSHFSLVLGLIPLFPLALMSVTIQNSSPTHAYTFWVAGSQSQIGSRAGNQSKIGSHASSTEYDRRFGR